MVDGGDLLQDKTAMRPVMKLLNGCAGNAVVLLGIAGLAVPASVYYDRAFNDLYGQYRSDDGTLITVRQFPAAFFHYRDNRGSCLDFWPTIDNSPPVIADGMACDTRGIETPWQASRTSGGALLFEHDTARGSLHTSFGETIGGSSPVRPR